MAQRIRHKLAIRDADIFDKSKGKVREQLCKHYTYRRIAKKPILEMRWKDVTCRDCWAGRGDVPDGMELKLVRKD